MRLSGVLALAGITGGCGGVMEPEGQILLYIDTDAPLPTEPGSVRDARAPAPLFDRLRIDILPIGSSAPCSSCTREVPIFEETLQRGQSFGIVSASGSSGTRVRVRIFREAFLVGSEPLERTTLETTVRLPPIPQRGVLEGFVFLSVDDVGQPIGDENDPIDWSPGAPGTSRVGTWEPAARLPCTRAAGPGEVCVPGGAFWMGALDDLTALDATPRLVTLSPFFLGAREVTVGDLRETERVVATGENRDPWPRDGITALVSSTSRARGCTFPTNTADPDLDSLPVNCFSFGLAQSYCEEIGADLPTEAQLEYASSGLESRPYVWGSDPPECEDAVHARSSTLSVSECFASEGTVGPAIVGSGDRDVLPLEDGEVFDLAGNLSELARDAWQAQNEGCWTPFLLRDPVCSNAREADPRYVARSGSWGSPPFALRASARHALNETYVRPDVGGDEEAKKTRLGPLVGFRCARPAN
jgi:formylglycine-generating enzyme